MAKRHPDDPEPEHPNRLHDDDRHDRPSHPIAVGDRPKPTPHNVPTQQDDPVPTTRVMLTGDDRNVLHEAWVPTDAYGFRIFVDDQPYEQIGVSPESGTTIFAPTR